MVAVLGEVRELARKKKGRSMTVFMIEVGEWVDRDRQNGTKRYIWRHLSPLSSPLSVSSNRSF